jgi:predicted Zn-dependent protease
LVFHFQRNNREVSLLKPIRKIKVVCLHVCLFSGKRAENKQINVAANFNQVPQPNGWLCPFTKLHVEGNLNKYTFMSDRFFAPLFSSVKPAFATLLLASSVWLTGCTGDKNGDAVFFPLENDLELGKQVSAQADSAYKSKGQLLNRNASNPKIRAAYAHLDKIVERILESGQVTYSDEFPWDVKIIDDKNVQNAFATPGGHIYVFTGLINHLDTEDQLAGVLGHEIAHADQRHSIKQLQKQYGISVISRLILGNESGNVERIFTQVGGQLVGLKFSRDYEREADEYSVLYLGATNFYACDGAAGFFQKMQAMENRGSQIEWASTHPAPGNRVQDIQAHARQRGCKTDAATDTGFQEFKRNLGL